MSESPLLTPPFKQCALIVRDLDEAVRRWVEELGIGPWTGYRLGPERLKEMRYHGREGRFSFRHALAWQGDVQFELIEPLEGESIFADHLEAHGEGMHHIGKYVPDHAAGGRRSRSPRGSCRSRALGASGPRVTARSPISSLPALPLIIELIEAPKVRIEPEFVYPPDG